MSYEQIQPELSHEEATALLVENFSDVFSDKVYDFAEDGPDSIVEFGRRKSAKFFPAFHRLSGNKKLQEALNIVSGIDKFAYEQICDELRENSDAVDDPEMTNNELAEVLPEFCKFISFIAAAVANQK